MNKYNFPPKLIFNFDKTMLDASGYKVKVLVHSQDPRLFTENETKLKHITLSLCISTSSFFIRPLVILPLKNLSPLYLKVVQFFSFSGQSNGFIDNSIWYEWVKTVLISHINKIRQQMRIPNQQTLFIVNSHSTRKHESTILFFQEHNIYVIILSAHSSTILQSLDLTVNSELKHLLRLRFKSKKSEDTLTKCNRLLFTIVKCFQGAFLAMHIRMALLE
jgi:DDE superfamily endonuclease